MTLDDFEVGDEVYLVSPKVVHAFHVDPDNIELITNKALVITHKRDHRGDLNWSAIQLRIKSSPYGFTWNYPPEAFIKANA